MPKGLQPVTPAELHRLAGRAHDLAAQIRAVHTRLRAAADEPTRRAGYRLDTAAGEIAATADDLARITSRGSCNADRGLCPDHGNTLTSTHGHTRCRRAGCRRSWDHDRGSLPCTEPAAYRVRDTAGGETLLYTGHANDARHRLTGARLTPIGAGRKR